MSVVLLLNQDLTRHREFSKKRLPGATNVTKCFSGSRRLVWLLPYITPAPKWHRVKNIFVSRGRAIWDVAILYLGEWRGCFDIFTFSGQLGKTHNRWCTLHLGLARLGGWGVGLNACPDGSGHLFTVTMIILRIFSNWSKSAQPGPAPECLVEFGGVQLLFGEWPNAECTNDYGSSLTTAFNRICSCESQRIIDHHPFEFESWSLEFKFKV